MKDAIEAAVRKPGRGTLPIRIADPPREIPLGLQLKILAHRDVTGSLLYFVLAAVPLLYAAHNRDTFAKAGLAFIATILLVLGLRTALPALVRAVRTLGRMRYGFMTLGRIVSCRLAWDRKGSEMPYAEFLSNWPVNLAKSQMDKFSGCFTTIVVAVFVVPFVLGILVFGFVLAIAHLGNASVDAEATQIMARWIAGAVFVVAVLLFLLRHNRRRMAHQVQPYMEWRRLAQPGPDDVYDEHAMRLVESAKERGVQISLKEPLPENHSGVELICQAEYSVQGERCEGEGRVRFSNRLNPAGVERLLFHPAQRKQVLFMAGLPEEAVVDAQGQWGPVPPAGPAVALALTGLVVGAVLVAFGVNLVWIIAHYR